MKRTVWLMAIVGVTLFSGCASWLASTPQAVETSTTESTGSKYTQENPAMEVPDTALVKSIPSVCAKDGVFKDIETRLMWQDATYNDAEDGAYKTDHNVGKVGDFEHAKNYCNRLYYHGFSDWRLPSVNELSAMHEEYGRRFVNSRDGDFWTSTPADAKRYFSVYPPDAYRYKKDSQESYYIRCVRCFK